MQSCHMRAGRATRRSPAGVLLGGVSLSAMLLAGGPAHARNLLTNGIVSPTASVMAAQQAAAAQAAAAGQQARASLAQAAAALQALKTAQQAAHALASQASSNVPNGLAPGGLRPDPGIPTDPTLWQGANLPVQSSRNGRVQVDITQFQQKAILNWQTFNVGSNTTVNFNQPSTDSVALNRVNDPNAAPSRILGQINAPGAVYIINHNGIIFGGGSQIDVHTLIASDLDVGSLNMTRTARDQFFLNTGIGSASTSVKGSTSLTQSFSTTSALMDAADSTGVRVEAGASITTSVVSPDSPGFVGLFGANVANSGTITSPAGEVALVAAQAVTLLPGAYPAATFPSGVLSGTGFRGIGFQIRQYATGYNPDGTPTGGGIFRPGTGSIVSDGLIETPRGTVVMNGDNITIGAQGVISADTSITRNSMVLLDAATSVDLEGIISVLPDQNGETLPLVNGSAASVSSTSQTFNPSFIEISGQLNVRLGSSGLVSAPSASVSLNAVTNSAALTGATFNLTASNQTGPQRVLLEPGATIDVAGLQDVELPASYNFISFQPRGQEFADMPLQRSGPLFGQTLWIDIRDSGTRSDGTTWVGTPLADASGYVGNVGQSISQLMTVGGAVSLKTDTGGGLSGNDVVLQAGSVINTAGGSVHFLPGMVQTTRLIGSDGRLYTMANADPNLTYVGIAGQFTVNHAHWGVTETWTNLTQSFSPGYVEGHDAGGVAITTVNPVLDGTLLFGSLPGERQIAAGLAPSGSNGIAPRQANGNQLPSQGYLTLYTPSSVVIGAVGTPALPDGFGPDTVLSPPGSPPPGPSSNFTAQSAFETLLSASQLSGYGLSALGVTANDLVVQTGSSLSLAAGGRFSVTAGGAIDIAGSVSAPGGQITLVTDRFGFQANNTTLFVAPITQSGSADIFVEGVLDVSGRWVNDTGALGAQALGPGFINGGSISIATDKSSGSSGASGPDATGSILLASGSLLDVSSGGYISPTGSPKTVSPDVMAGRGGSISLTLYQGLDFVPTTTTGTGPTTPTSGLVAQIQLDGVLRAYGFASGGTLTIGAPELIQIGGPPIGVGNGLQLPISLFHDDGFSKFTIESTPDNYSGVTAQIALAAGVSLTLQQQNLSGTADYHAVSTGTDIAAVAPVVTLPDDQRVPVNLTLKSDDILLDAGSSIVTDPMAQISLVGTPNFVPRAASPENRAQDVLLLGTIVDHGGAVTINAANTWLGPQALIDLSGTFIANSRFGVPGGPLVSGTLLPGGTFTIDATPPGLITKTDVNNAMTGTSVVAQSGSMVDVSGAAATIRVMSQDGTAATAVAVPSWSDAGTVSVNAGAFLWGGRFRASAPDPRASGGTLMLGGSTISLEQTSTDVIAALAVATPASPTAMGAPPAGPAPFTVAVDLLAPFSNVFLYAGSAVGGAKRIFTDLPDNTYGVDPPLLTDFDINGTVSLSVVNRLEIAASTITSLSSSPGTVTLAAPYVNLTGGGGTANGGTGTLTVIGQSIDIEGATLSGFAKSSLISTGDIRLSTPKAENGVTVASNGTIVDQSIFLGTLASAGNLVLSAQRVYPVSAVNFTISTPGSVSFEAPAGSNTAVPLSAGGSITVSALNIQQNGNLFAPLGQITLGVSANGTQQVTLGAGSLTSVSLGNALVPFGQTEDGINWFYNDSALPLTAPSAKALVLNGQGVNVAAGSTVDVSGGGDLQAMEFIAGKGGSRDTLTTTPAGQTVYALLPASSDPVAALDINMTTAKSASAAGDAYPLAGTQVYLAGGNGIAAGVYTLYSGHYATVPGALRVVDEGSNLGRNVPSGTTLPDGTTLISGHYTQSTLPQTRTSGSELFAVQTGPVWSNYSQYAYSSANSYFPKLAQKNSVNVPSLPLDAGRLAVVAQQAIVLAGTALTQAAPGGRGGQLDISGNNLDVVSPDQLASGTIPTGYIGIDVTQLDKFGFQSVLIGGLRSDLLNGTGTLITPTATNVLVDTHGVALTAPEVLLVAQPAASVQTITATVTNNGATFQLQVPVTTSAGGSVTIASGSIIETEGELQTGFGRNYFFASAPSGSSNPGAIASKLGGTLDASGTAISGANVLTLPIYLNGALINGGTLTGPLAYPGNAGGGALFVATNDPTLTVAGPTGGGSAQSLTINFSNFAGSPVTGSLVLPGSNVGTVSIAGGASISTQTMTVQATAQSKAISIDPAATVNAKQVNLTARTIGIGQGSNDSLSLSNANLSQFAGAQGLSLKAVAGGITFYGAVDFNPGPSMQRLVMDAGSINGTGSDVAINMSGGTLTLVNSGAANAGAPPTASAAGTFQVGAAQIDLQGGSQTISGFSQVSLNASNQVFLENSGALTLGANGAVVNLALTTPNVLVGGGTASGTGSQFVLTTLGNVSISTPSGTQTAPPASTEIGGSFAITAAGITDDSTIQVQAGALTLDATGAAGLTLGAHAYTAAGGYKASLRDVDTYVGGGKVVLQADAGNVVTAAGSVIDLSQPAGGLGYGGELDIQAGGSAQLSGTIQAHGAPGLGGSFKLDTIGSLTLDPLADQLLAGGFFGTIDIHTRQGNLNLSSGNTLKANSITLTADDPSPGNGEVTIAGLVDARGYSGTSGDGTGEAGGMVALYGANAVVLFGGGAIDASTRHVDKRGGDVTLGIAANATGSIDLQGGTINVSGGTLGGLVGGTVLLRAPIIPSATVVGGGDVRIAGLNATITGARSVTVEDYLTISTDGNPVWNGFIDPSNDPNGLFGSAIRSFVNGTFVGNVSYGFANAIARLTPLAAELGPGVLKLEPGVELVNDNPAINNGNITVVSNWNLAAGTAGNLQNGAYVDNQSYVNFDYRLVEQFGSQPVQVVPGVLTLRAVGNINVNASISDGFFQFHDYSNPSYTNSLIAYVQGSGRGVDLNGSAFLYNLSTFSNVPVPVAPYNPASNAISPILPAALAGADLFPNALNVCIANCGTGTATVVAVTNPGSWSYRLTAGASVASANPDTMLPSATFAVTGALPGGGSVILDQHGTYSQQLADGTKATVNLPTMVRTGTGNISIAAAQDVVLQDQTAPGVIYTAGVNTPKLPGPGYGLVGSGITATVSVANPSGFFEPQLLMYGDVNTGFVDVFGPPSAAAFPYQAGDIDIVAQRDIKGFGNPSTVIVKPFGGGTTQIPALQYFAPWLLSDADISPVGLHGSASLLGAGVFAPSGGNIASQSAWWIQYGSFQQGILSAGGNVTAIAGRDMIDVSVSLPSTGRVSGGLSSTDTPVTHVYGSGNMTIQVGRDLRGGSFYEGSGSAAISVHGSVGANGTLSGSIPDVPLLAVDSGQIQLTAHGSISIAGVVNPAELHAQAPSSADPTGLFSVPLFMDTYGQSSAVTLIAIAGDLNIGKSPTQSIYGNAPSFYPASLDAVALRGDITTNGLNAAGIVLSGSQAGTFQMVAQGNVDLTGDLPATALSTLFPVFSAGPALLDGAFNPYRPNDGFDGASSSPVLAQKQDTIDSRIYAVTGSITGAGRIQINRPATVIAGTDIVDLNLTVENIAASDVSTVEAGRDIRYTGLHNLGGLTIAGPGFFVVQAGGDLGPFLPAAFDTALSATVQEGIASVGNTSPIPVGDQFTPGGSIGMYDPALFGPYKGLPTSNPPPVERRNGLLPTTGADIIALAGVAKGADYAAVISTYIDPANAAKVPQNYLPELETFLAGIGIPTAGTADAWAAFNKLPATLQQVFVDQIYFAELKSVAITGSSTFQKSQVGYQMVNTLFPAKLGYTANALGGGTNGANQLVHTGDIDLLHATVQTDQSGNISLLAPGGNILVGSLATEPNPNLKLNNLGILTLGGGAINTFTDASVLVNSSRVFTEQGGDILMWSSNGDLDAGRGAKTTLSQPPLNVFYNGDAYQSIDLTGLVTGAGIGVLRTSSDAATSNLYLLAPRGTIDASDAGIRVSGNAVLEAVVVLNSNNIQVSGTTTGVPVVAAPNVGALTAASGTAGAATKAAELPTGATGNGDQPSVFTVEVIGYGGGSDQPTGQTDQWGQTDQKDQKDKRGN